MAALNVFFSYRGCLTHSRQQSYNLRREVCLPIAATMGYFRPFQIFQSWI